MNKIPPFNYFLVFVTIIILWTFLAFVVFGEQETPVEDTDKLIELLESVHTPRVTTMEELHEEICQKVPESPLCGDIELLRRIDSIGREKGVPTRLLIGIMFAESTLNTHFNKPACAHYNNPYWIKWRKYDTGKVVWYTKTKGKPDENGCWLFRFDSIEQATYSLANTISLWYWKCKNNVVCISFAYVGNPEVSEKSWVNRIEMWH